MLELSINLMHNKCVSDLSKKIVHFSRIDSKNLELLNQNFRDLHKVLDLKINVPIGIVVTSDAYFDFLKENNLRSKITDLLTTIHYEMPESIMQVSNHIKKMIERSMLPEEIIMKLSQKLNDTLDENEVIVGDKKNVAPDIEDVLTALKKTWSEHFQPKNLLFYKQHKKNIFKDGIPVLIQQMLNSNKTGTILSSNLLTNTNTRLKNGEEEELRLISLKIKKHFYFPQIINWTIYKNKIHITDIKPG